MIPPGQLRVGILGFGPEGSDDSSGESVADGHSSAIGRLMMGNSRLRSTQPVLANLRDPLNKIISALIRQQRLIELSIQRLPAAAELEQAERLELSEVSRKLTSQHIILANIIFGLRFAANTLAVNDESMSAPFPDEIDYVTVLGLDPE
ncbi:unnamed protein product [Prorocentrum cordatum]|uniref:Uncharacterized protein n=1 Tax=Prorocentrum cordatum TaxID=2364126 RepID=A0ABN9TPI1_9DINO|nr:unnamed protein product [Polarella glacialis]